MKAKINRLLDRVSRHLSTLSQAASCKRALYKAALCKGALGTNTFSNDALGKGAPRKSTFGLNAFSLNAFCLNTITCTALLFTSLSVFAHQQKQAITKVYFNSRTSNIEIMHRFDIHDAEHAVREIFGGTADILNKPETQQQFSQYVADRFDIFNANKQALALVSVGYEIDGKHFWVYQETPAPDSLSGMYISHNALRDIWHSQTNTINIEGKGKLKTLTFTDNTELLEVSF